jgi:predicted transcriptional regulator|tara:strand:+ start:364 stop:813 length:450 start_codon:yes stop_codon:yes gene_type:complete
MDKSTEQQERSPMKVPRYLQCQDLEPDLILAQMLMANGIIKNAAEALGVSRSGLSTFLKTNEEFKDIRNETREINLDTMESRLQAAIEDPQSRNHITAVIFGLKCLGKERGYVERQELTGAGGGELGQIVAPVRNVSAEEWAEQNKAQA